jgi:hypothetical protein
MAGEQKRKARAAWVTKALLLGYTFEWGVFSAKACYMRLPNGEWCVEDVPVSKQLTNIRQAFLRPPMAFPAVWVAAIKALELSGVYDAEIARRNVGADSGPGARLRKRGRKRSSPKGFSKSLGTGP